MHVSLSKRLRYISVRKDRFALLLIVVAVGVFRLSSLWNADLPTGDEVNTYINAAQNLVRSGALPPMYEHPLVAVCYASVILILRSFDVCLAGVWASYIWFLILGIVGAIGVFSGLRKHCGDIPALAAALIYGCCPAILLYQPRGDINLFLALVPWVVLVVEDGFEKRSVIKCLIGGAGLGLIWLSRSDGFTFMAALLLITGVTFWRKWRCLLLVMAGVAMIICSYKGVYRVQHGSGGGSSIHRAWEAFYQAEGLHDGLGGSWQDFTVRGQQRFGLPEEHGSSFALLLWEARAAVIQRIKSNIGLFAEYHSKAFGLPAWIGLFLIAGCCFTDRLLRVAAFWVLPVMLTAVPINLFYLQRPYFILIAGGWCIGATLGLLGWVSLLRKGIKRLKKDSLAVCYEKAVAVFACVLLLTVIGYVSWMLQSRSSGSVSWQRMASVLCCLEKSVRGAPNACYISPPFAGSNSIQIFIDQPSSDGGYSMLDAKYEQETILASLKAGGVRYVLALKERPASWHFSGDNVAIVACNARNDLCLKFIDWNIR